MYLICSKAVWGEEMKRQPKGNWLRGFRIAATLSLHVCDVSLGRVSVRTTRFNIVTFSYNFPLLLFCSLRRRILEYYSVSMFPVVLIDFWFSRCLFFIQCWRYYILIALYLLDMKLVMFPLFDFYYPPTRKMKNKKGSPLCLHLIFGVL